MYIYIFTLCEIAHLDIYIYMISKRIGILVRTTMYRFQPFVTLGFSPKLGPMEVWWSAIYFSHMYYLIRIDIYIYIRYILFDLIYITPCLILMLSLMTAGSHYARSFSIPSIFCRFSAYESPQAYGEACVQLGQHPVGVAVCIYLHENPLMSQLPSQDSTTYPVW